MNKNTLTFERKLYVAPACKTHVLQIEENIMSFETDGIQQMEYDEDELTA